MATLNKNNGQILEQVNLGNVPHSGFPQSYNCRGTMNMGTLVPIRCYETLPGDTIQSATSATLQFQPLAVPTLDNMYMKHETFKIPYRILWKRWDEFWTKGENLDDTSVPPSFSFYEAIESI